MFGRAASGGENSDSKGCTEEKENNIDDKNESCQILVKTENPYSNNHFKSD